MKSDNRSFTKRMLAGFSAAFLALNTGAFFSVSAPVAFASSGVNYIGGSDALYIGHADSEEKTGESGGNGPAAKAIDGNPNTYWHTNWSQGGETAGPHWISVGAYQNETLQNCTFTGLEYTQRQGSSGTGAKNGIVGNYEIYVTDTAITQSDGFTEDKKVKTGTFKDQNDPQLVEFGAEKSGKFVTLKATSTLSGSSNLTAVGEIRLQGNCTTATGEKIVSPVKPTQSEDTAKITIPQIDGVTYRIDGETKTGEVTLKEGQTAVTASPQSGYKFIGEQSVEYSFEYYGVAVPATIPSLTNDFRRTGGSWTASQNITVVRPEGFAQSAQLLIDELNAYTKGTAIKGAASGQGVQIVIDSAQKDQLGEEGYKLEITQTGVKITAAANKGAFWGTRTLSQMLRQSLTLPAGEVTDKPAYSERGVTLCACQINFSTEWIDRFLNEMADLKLNQVLMEMKLKSDEYPVANTFSYYSREDVKKFVQKADAYGIDVIPEINSPGHMNIWLENLPEYQLKDTAGRGSSDRLDITNPQAVQFYKTLIDEYDGVFSTKYWHMGADEYLMGASYATYPQLAEYAKQVTGKQNATGPDAFTYFINDINKYVKSKGKTLRIWNDGIVQTTAVTLDKDIVIEHWLGSGRSAASLAADGYKLVNANLELYFARPSPYPIQRNGPAYLYNNPNFGVHIFKGSTVAKEHMDKVLGAKLSIWPDNGTAQTENEVEKDIYEAMRYVAQINWAGGNPKDNPTYADFKAKRVDKITRSPMWENVNRKPLEDGLYTISQPNGKSLQLKGNAKLGGNDEWTLVSTPDHYYQLRNMATNQCLSVVSGYKHLQTVTQVGARPEARPCVDVSKIYTGAQTGNSGYGERNPQKWMLLPVPGSDDTFEVINSVTLQHLAVAEGTEDHIDFRTFNGVAKDTKPAAGEVVQFPDDMTDDVWRIVPSVRSFEARAVAQPPQAYIAENGAGATEITVTVTNRSDAPLNNVVVTPPVKLGWEIDAQPKTIATIPVGGSAEAVFSAAPEAYLGDAEFVFTVSAGDESFEARAQAVAVCGQSSAFAAAVAADSEEQSGEGAGNGVKGAAVDGNPDTYWHTQWNGSKPNFPHYIDLQVGDAAQDLCGFVYTPRQGQANGRVKDYEIYAADELPSDEAGWGEPVAKGSFADGTATQTVPLNVKAKYLRFKGLNAQSSVSDGAVMSVAELQVIKGVAPKIRLASPQEPEYEGLTYTIPEIEGVKYSADGKQVEPGQYSVDAGTVVSFSAEPEAGFYFADSFYDARAEFIPWEHEFLNQVSPEPPVWDDENMTFTVPDSQYFEYLIGSSVLTPGVQPTVEANYLAHVTAQLKADAVGVQIAPDAVTAWDHQFPNKTVTPGTDPDAGDGSGGVPDPDAGDNARVPQAPVASDPASCTLKPYVEIPQSDYFTYMISVAGGAERKVDAGKFEYEYGESVKVTAVPNQGVQVQAGVQSVWTWRAPVPEACGGISPLTPSLLQDSKVALSVKSHPRTGADLLLLLGAAVLCGLLGALFLSSKDKTQ